MTATKPVVSFVIPCFNQSKWLYEAVSSAFLSYSGPKEIIIVNDGSDEAGWEARLNELKKEFSSVTVIDHKTNRGLSAARNTGISASTGEFIQLLDSDDFLVPGKIDFQIAHFNLTKDLSISVTDYLLCDETASSFHEDDTCIGSFALNLNNFLYNWERGLTIPIHCGLFRGTVLGDAEFNESLVGKEDWVFWCKQAYLGKKIAYFNSVGGIYRQHSKSMTKANHKLMGGNWLKAAKIINGIIENSDPLFLADAMNWYRKYYDPSP